MRLYNFRFGPRPIGNETLIFGVVIAFVLTLISLFAMPGLNVPGDYGVCVASPNTWVLPRFLSWLLNILAVAATALLLSAMNRKYNLIPTSQPILPVCFLLLLSMNAAVTCRLGTPVMLMAVNAACLYILFDTYERPNSTQEFFIIATLLSFGSMIDYSFLMMVPVYVAGGFVMKSFRLREAIAFIFGLVSPYWIMVGMGIVGVDHFRLPMSTSLSHQLELNPDMMRCFISIGLASLIALVASIYNSVSLLHGNARVRCLHLSVNILGYVCLIAMIGDYNNLLAYAGTIYLWMSLEIVGLYANRPSGSSNLWMMICLIVFFILFLYMI